MKAFDKIAFDIWISNISNASVNPTDGLSDEYPAKYSIAVCSNNPKIKSLS